MCIWRSESCKMCDGTFQLSHQDGVNWSETVFLETTLMATLLVCGKFWCFHCWFITESCCRRDWSKASWNLHGFPVALRFVWWCNSFVQPVLLPIQWNTRNRCVVPKANGFTCCSLTRRLSEHVQRFWRMWNNKVNKSQRGAENYVFVLGSGGWISRSKLGSQWRSSFFKHKCQCVWFVPVKHRRSWSRVFVGNIDFCQKCRLRKNDFWQRTVVFWSSDSWLYMYPYSVRFERLALWELGNNDSRHNGREHKRKRSDWQKRVQDAGSSGIFTHLHTDRHLLIVVRYKCCSPRTGSLLAVLKTVCAAGVCSTWREKHHFAMFEYQQVWSVLFYNSVITKPVIHARIVVEMGSYLTKRVPIQ